MTLGCINSQHRRFLRYKKKFKCKGSTRMLQMGEPYTGFRLVSIIPILLLAFCLFTLLQLVNEKFAIRAFC